MSNIVDLDILFEKPEKKIKFKSKDGQEIILTLHISPEIALSSIKSHKDGKNELEQAAEVARLLIKDQHSREVDTKWVLKNIKYEYLLYISSYITDNVYSAMEIIQNDKNGNGTKKK